MHYVVAGGAGFIGSHLVKFLLCQEKTRRIVVYDNFSSGRREHFGQVMNDSRLQLIQADLKQTERWLEAAAGADVLYHFASNPDIARALREPDVDFWQGTFLTHQVAEAMRCHRIPKVLYASGSGIYGETGPEEIFEDHAPLLPISTYGASKLAGEAWLCAYAHMFDLQVAAFRFANVVGPHQTHGVAYDFIHKLRAHPGYLDILGDGTQSKSYIHVADVVQALYLVEKSDFPLYSYYNVATQDAMTVKEIADQVVAAMQLTGVEYRYSGGNRGWKGDVPRVRLNSNKLRALGWQHTFSSHQAMAEAIGAMLGQPMAEGSK
jgi:UDP-glucose 4-epimerase